MVISFTFFMNMPPPILLAVLLETYTLVILILSEFYKCRAAPESISELKFIVLLYKIRLFP